MKLLFCTHGYPPELQGGTERSARFLARALTRAGHEVVVFSGTLRRGEGGEVAVREERDEFVGGSVRVLRIARPDLYFDHWQKSKSARVAATFREVLKREEPDLVHVLHWIRLTRNLVRLAGEEGIPAVVTLNDSFVTCPLVFRVRPASEASCESSLGMMSCDSCASGVPPLTPWVSMEARMMELAQRAQDLDGELRMARARIVPTRVHGERQLALRGDSMAEFEFECLPPAAAPTFGVRGAGVGPRVAGEPLVLASWGALSELKGTDLLFAALDQLGTDAGVELLLMGAEPSPGFVADLQARFPAARVQHSDAFEVHELNTLLAGRAHLHVCASRAPESYGLVLEEARALGLPSLVPRIGAFLERGGEAQGAAYFDPGDARSLSLAIERLRADESSLARLRGCVPAPVSAQEVLEGHLAVYERAIEAGASEAVPATEWYAERMSTFAEEEWDRNLSSRDPRELGFPEVGEG